MLNIFLRFFNYEKEFCKDIKDCLVNLKFVKFGFIKFGEYCDVL